MALSRVARPWTSAPPGGPSPFVYPPSVIVHLCELGQVLVDKTLGVEAMCAAVAASPAIYASSVDKVRYHDNPVDLIPSTSDLLPSAIYHLPSTSWNVERRSWKV